MIAWKAALMGLTALVSTSATEPTKPPEPLSTYPQVKQVLCGFGASGTAFRIDADTYLSVAHVTKMFGCKINGEPIQVVESAGDFSILHTDDSREGGLPISCEGFKAGQFYFGTGYAYGWQLQRTVMLRAHFLDQIGGIAHGMRILYGPETVIPGMSGGPVMNAKGEVVGMVNAYNKIWGLSFSLSLSDTSLCD